LLKGTLENLQYLVEAGISVTSNKTLQAEGWRLSQKFEIPEVRILHNWVKIFRSRILILSPVDTGCLILKFPKVNGSEG
jgi:hypothetical protein